MATRMLPPTIAARPSRQRGAVLYVALIMLVLLALIGIIGMQVAGLQERMSANYRATNLAFQAAESVVRNAECAIESIQDSIPVGTCTIITATDINPRCDDGFDPGAWVDARSVDAVPAVNVRQIDTCVVGEGPLDEGGPVGANPFPIYQITAYSADDEDAPTSSAAVDTVFKL